MTATNILPDNFLEEDFDIDTLLPSELEETIEIAFVVYEDMPRSEPKRKKFRTVLNNCINKLKELRNGLNQFSLAH